MPILQSVTFSNNPWGYCQ